MTDIIEVLIKRYAVKQFNPERQVSHAVQQQLKTALQLSPSSVNSQPWHFVVATSAEGKDTIAQAAQGVYQANQPKISDASMVVVFCAKQAVSDEYLQHITDCEDRDGRFADAKSKEMAMKVRQFYANLHREQFDDVAHWAQKQVYLNVGNFLLAAAALEVDAVPIEGVDLAMLNQVLNLDSKGVEATVVVALGYQSAEDFNAKLPKSRLPEPEIITEL